jgi:uncharacterized membrane protein YhaH (DUF805 family)
MLEWMLMPYRRYAEFSGRSQRKEYWMFTLFSVIVTVVLAVLMVVGGFDFFSDPTLQSSEPNVLGYIAVGLFLVFILGSIIPSIAVSVRRFHDRDMSGWWVLGFAVLSNLPYVGWLFSIGNLVIMALPGTPGQNRFGNDPLDPNAAEVFS